MKTPRFYAALPLVVIFVFLGSLQASTNLDFESTTSLSQLPSRWSVFGNVSQLSLQSSCQAPSSMIGTTGTKGVQYNAPTGTISWLEYALPSAKSSVSIGMAYKTGRSYSWVEGPHFLGYASYAQGDLSRASDERNSYDNVREFRISPGENTDTGARVTVADNTWYWVTMKYVAGQPTRMNIYDSSLLLVGTATWNGGLNANVDAIFLGNDIQGSNNSFTTCLDNFMEDDVNAVFPLLPIPPDTTPPTVPTNLSATAVSSSQINLAWTASTDPGNPGALISYGIFRNGTLVATVAGTTSYNDNGLAASTTYNYAITAIDPSKNSSAQTLPVSATTQNPPPLGPGNYTTLGGFAATIISQSSDGTMWLGTVTVNNVVVPTLWTISGGSGNSALSLR